MACIVFMYGMYSAALSCIKGLTGKPLDSLLYAEHLSDF